MTGRGRTRVTDNVQVINFVLLAIGVWLFNAAWIFGYPTNEPAIDAHLNELLACAGLVIIAGARMRRPLRHPLFDAVNMMLGGWLALAPFLVEYGDDRAQTARVNDLICGVLVVILAGTSLILTRRAQRRSRVDRR